MINDNNLINKVESIEKLCSASKAYKFLKNPVKYFKGAILPKIVTLKDKEIKVRLFNEENFSILYPSSLDIYLWGLKSHESEFRLTKFLINHVSSGDKFFDIGAHFGFYSRLVSSLSNSEVYSFEPSKKSFEILKINCESNPKIQCFNNAILSSSKTIKFHELPTKYSEFNSINIQQYHNESWFSTEELDEFEIVGFSLSEFIERESISMPKFIKIDVEGLEKEVISGLKNENILQHYIIVEFTLGNIELQEYLGTSNFFELHNFKANMINDEGLLEELKGNDILAHIKDRGLDSDNIIFSNFKT